MDAWEDFKSRTAIHGFSEYGGMRGAIWKTLWVILAVGVAVFCFWQIFILFDGFLAHQSTTSIKISKSRPLPEVGILLDPISYLNMTTGDDRFKELLGVMSYKIEGISCPYQPEEQKERVVKPDLPLEATAEWHPQTTDVAPFLEELKKTLPTHENLFESVNLEKKRKYKGRVQTSKLVITDRGPLFKITFGNFTTSQVDLVTITMKKATLPLFYFMILGSAMALYDPQLPIELVNQRSYTMTVQMFQYKRASRYCGAENVEAQLSCEGYCLYQKGLKAEVCIPYMGEKPLPAANNVCAFADYEKCFGWAHVCEKECEKCTTCRPCNEVEATIESVEHVDVAEEDDIVSIGLSFPEGKRIQTYEEREALGVVAFLSQIGGVMGLCFGVSILSLLHLLYSILMMGKERIIGRGMTDSSVFQVAKW